MNTALKIGGYTLGLLAVFGAAVGIGAASTQPTVAPVLRRRAAFPRTTSEHGRDDYGARRPLRRRCPAG